MVKKRCSVKEAIKGVSMKDKIKKFFYILVLVIIILFLSSYIKFKIIKIDNTYYDDFKGKLEMTMQKKSNFYMWELTSFEWDKMYIIKPYTSKTEMEEIVGIKWTTYNTYLGYLFEKTYFGEYPIDDDIFHKLVFVKDNKIILDITINRAMADFTNIDEIIYYNDYFNIELKDNRHLINKE